MVSIKAFSFNTLLIWITFTAIRSQYIYKCLEQKNNYVCDADWGDFNITEEFRHLSASLPANGKAMNRLEIHNTYITEIPENVFFNISFTYIDVFEAQNLTRIHSRAFGVNAITGLKAKLYISRPSKLRNYPPDYDLYRALNSLVNTPKLEINLETGYYLHEIPDYAFNVDQRGLKWLAFDENNYNISRIGDYAFHGLLALIEIVFKRIPIGKISSHSFDFSNASDQMLNINFGSCRITDDSIEDGSFSDAKRPLTLNLESNQIQYINETKFSNFLKSEQRNILQLYGNYLNCDDVTPYEWLLRNISQYKNQIQGAFCSDGTEIWDLDISVRSTTPFTTTHSYDNTYYNITYYNRDFYYYTFFNTNFYINIFNSNNYYYNKYDSDNFKQNTFFNNTFYENTFYKSTFYSNPFNNNTFYYNTFYDNTFYDNTFYKNTFYNTTFDSNIFYNNTFDNSTFYNTTFDNNTFFNTTFDNNTLYNNTFCNNTFYNNTFYNTILYNTTFHNNVFENTAFYYTTLNNATFYNIIFDNATFNNIIFYNTIFYNTTFDNIVYNNTTSYNTTFYNTSFENTFFFNTTLDNTYFYNTIFENTTLHSTSFENTAFYKTTFDNSFFLNNPSITQPSTVTPSMTPPSIEELP